MWNQVLPETKDNCPVRVTPRPRLARSGSHDGDWSPRLDGPHFAQSPTNGGLTKQCVWKHAKRPVSRGPGLSAATRRGERPHTPRSVDMSLEPGAQARPGSKAPASARGPPPRVNPVGTALGRHVGLDRLCLLMEAWPSTDKSGHHRVWPSRKTSWRCHGGHRGHALSRPRPATLEETRPRHQAFDGLPGASSGKVGRVESTLARGGAARIERITLRECSCQASKQSSQSAGWLSWSSCCWERSAASARPAGPGRRRRPRPEASRSESSRGLACGDTTQWKRYTYE